MEISRQFAHVRVFLIANKAEEELLLLLLCLLCLLLLLLLTVSFAVTKESAISE
jgi:hypothetical protein